MFNNPEENTGNEHKKFKEETGNGVFVFGKNWIDFLDSPKLIKILKKARKYPFIKIIIIATAIFFATGYFQSQEERIQEIKGQLEKLKPDSNSLEDDHKSPQNHGGNTTLFTGKSTVDHRCRYRTSSGPLQLNENLIEFGDLPPKVQELAESYAAELGKCISKVY